MQEFEVQGACLQLDTTYPLLNCTSRDRTFPERATDLLSRTHKMPEDQHRVILVGGGPVGLVAAHILAAAGIPFVLLEQRSTIVPLQGAGIVLFPHTQRVLHQLGLMERIRGISEQFGAARVVNSWGWHYTTVATSAWTEEK
jgi:NADPH-dependent glutamate synthase beta subunit-like oxidoreductase